MNKEEAIKYLQQLYPNGGHCWLDEQRIEAIGMAVKALQEEPEITHEIIGKVIKAEREAVWDDARLLAPRLTTEEALIIEIFKLINNE